MNKLHSPKSLRTAAVACAFAIAAGPLAQPAEAGLLKKAIRVSPWIAVGVGAKYLYDKHQEKKSRQAADSGSYVAPAEPQSRSPALTQKGFKSRMKSAAKYEKAGKYSQAADEYEKARKLTKDEVKLAQVDEGIVRCRQEMSRIRETTVLEGAISHIEAKGHAQSTFEGRMEMGSYCESLKEFGLAKEQYTVAKTYASGDEQLRAANEGISRSVKGIIGPEAEQIGTNVAEKK